MTSNMVVSILVCATQLLDVSLRAVTRTEYLWATVILIRSVGDGSTGQEINSESMKLTKNEGDQWVYYFMVNLGVSAGD